MTYDELKTLITETYINCPFGIIESSRVVADKVWPLLNGAPTAPTIPDDHALISHHDCGTAEDIITGLAALGVRPLVEAYLTGRGYDDAQASVAALYKAVAP